MCVCVCDTFCVCASVQFLIINVWNMKTFVVLIIFVRFGDLFLVFVLIHPRTITVLFIHYRQIYTQACALRIPVCYSYGYPDPGYLSRVEHELAAKGVTEKDLTGTQRQFVRHPDQFCPKASLGDFSSKFD